MFNALYEMKIFYYCIMVLIFTSASVDIYWLFDLSPKSTILIIVNAITPAIVLVYLFLLIRKKRNLKKKFNEEFFKLFSKN